MIGYKVVYNTGKELVSAILGLGAEKSILNITYKPGVATRKRKYGPFVFDSFGNALYFASGGTRGQEIWECETIGNFFHLDKVIDACDVSYIESKNTWRAAFKNMLTSSSNWIYAGPHEYNRSDAPEGTFCCESIKLLKRVWKSDDD